MKGIKTFLKLIEINLKAKSIESRVSEIKTT